MAFAIGKSGCKCPEPALVMWAFWGPRHRCHPSCSCPPVVKKWEETENEIPMPSKFSSVLMVWSMKSIWHLGNYIPYLCVRVLQAFGSQKIAPRLPKAAIHVILQPMFSFFFLKKGWFWGPLNCLSPDQEPSFNQLCNHTIFRRRNASPSFLLVQQLPTYLLSKVTTLAYTMPYNEFGPEAAYCQLPQPIRLALASS